MIRKIILLITFLIAFSFIYLTPNIVEGKDLDLTSAQNSVGKRFARKFCEAKEDGLSVDNASEYALNNTYLKFVAFPNDKSYLQDLLKFTIEEIRKDCGNEISRSDENELKEFFKEESEIASNRDLYLPN